MKQPPQTAREVWEQVLPAVQARLNRPAIRNWLKTVEPISLEDNLLTLGVSTEFARDWLERRAADHIRACLSEALGEPAQVALVLSQLDLGLPGARPNPPPTPPAPERRNPEARCLTPLNPRYTFQDFVVGRSNQFAQAAALAVAKAPGKAYNPLFLYGGVGLGKTHLTQAVGHHVLRAFPSLKVCYISGDTFTYDVVSSIREDRFSQFRRRYREVELWLVDDIQFIASRERTEAEFFQAFNALYDTERQIVITSDRPPKDLQVMDPRLRSRFEWGLIVDIKPPDLETRIAILQRKAQGEGVEVPDDVTRYIAHIVQSNIRILEGALIKLVATASFSGQPITLAMAMEHLRDHSVGLGTKPVNIALVQQVVAEHFHLSLADLNARRRTREIVFPRQLAMYLAREVVRASFPEIARQFGGKDHSTVIHACSKIKKDMEANPQVGAMVAELSQKLGVAI
jgi:chromosomal replication initiator protein